MMDVQEIARRAGIAHRNVRYMLEHRAVPGLHPDVDETRPGRPRRYAAHEGYWIALATLLHRGKVQRTSVTEILRWLDTVPWPIPGSRRLERVLYGEYRSARDFLSSQADPDAELALRIGDGEALCIELGKADTGWFTARPCALLSHYKPLVVIRIDLTELRHRFGLLDGAPVDE